MTKYYDIIYAPLISEQSMKLAEKENKYTFKVDPRANKIEVKKAIEMIFKVNVLSVNTMIIFPKKKRVGKYEGYVSTYKKAVVELASGQKIDSFMV